jgi:hypothetical protein
LSWLRTELSRGLLEHVYEPSGLQKSREFLQQMNNYQLFKILCHGVKNHKNNEELKSEKTEERIEGTK